MAEPQDALWVLVLLIGGAMIVYAALPTYAETAVTDARWVGRMGAVLLVLSIWQLVARAYSEASLVAG